MDWNILTKVYKVESKDYYVLDDKGNSIICRLPGRFKNKYHLKQNKQYVLDIVTVGDRVKISLNKDGRGEITKIMERENYFSRKAPLLKGTAGKGERLEQIFASNLDNIVIVTSANHPSFNNRLTDRIIVAAESSNINVKVIINKSDIGNEEEIGYWKEIYEACGYEVLVTSFLTNSGLYQLKELLANSINLFCGQSGVGKSSLLNGLYPELDFKVGEVSESTFKGKHTTVASVLKVVDDNTIIIDSPGIREFAPYGLKKEYLAHYFADMEPFINNCKFNTCTHQHEPGCAIIDAVEKEEIAFERYYSYLNILENLEDVPKYWNYYQAIYSSLFPITFPLKDFVLYSAIRRSSGVKSPQRVTVIVDLPNIFNWTFKDLPVFRTPEMDSIL